MIAWIENNIEGIPIYPKVLASFGFDLDCTFCTPTKYGRVVGTEEQFKRLKKRFPGLEILFLGTGDDLFLFEFGLAMKGDM